MQGKWEVSSVVTGRGGKVSGYEGATVRIAGDDYSITTRKITNTYDLRDVDPTQNPAHITLVAESGTQIAKFQCLVKVSKTEIVLVRPSNPWDNVRPRSIDPDKSSTDLVFRLVRRKEEP
jgi:hypothetical protein